MESETKIELEHRRDMLAIMMAILCTKNGLDGAKRQAIECWEEANRAVGLTADPGSAAR